MMHDRAQGSSDDGHEFSVAEESVDHSLLELLQQHDAEAARLQRQGELDRVYLKPLLFALNCSKRERRHSNQAWLS